MPGRIKLPGGQSVNVGLRAAGGPVTKGQPYIVGEKRPELFVPNSSGKILPRVPESTSGSASSAARAMSHINLYVDGKKMTEVVVDHMGNVLSGGRTTVGLT